MCGVGRFNRGSSKVTDLESIYTDWVMLARSVTNYVVSRQNEDGGYTFCRFTDSNAQDTHYGFAILDLLGFPSQMLNKQLSGCANLFQTVYIRIIM